MANGINKEFVGLDIEAGGSWHCTIPVDGERLSEGAEHTGRVIRSLFDACEGFIRPTEIEYTVRMFSTDGPISMLFQDNGSLGEVERITVTDKNGLTAADIPFEPTIKQDGTIRYIRRIDIHRTQVRLTLHGYEGWIDRTVDQYTKCARLNRVYNEQAKKDPIEIQFTHIPAGSNDDGVVKSALTINTRTDIWFEETSVGRTNRCQLESFFERLFAGLDIVKTSVNERGRNGVFRELLPD